MLDLEVDSRYRSVMYRDVVGCRGMRRWRELVVARADLYEVGGITAGDVGNDGSDGGIGGSMLEAGRER